MYNLDKLNQIQPELSQEDIVDLIIADMEVANSNDQNNELENYLFNYGRKRLLLAYYPSDKLGYFMTYVTNNKNQERLKNETTFIYLAAKKIMEQIVNREKKEIKYTLSTENEKMADWANEKGDEIFHWNKREIRKSDGRNSSFSFTTKIKPEDECK